MEMEPMGLELHRVVEEPSSYASVATFGLPCNGVPSYLAVKKSEMKNELFHSSKVNSARAVSLLKPRVLMGVAEASDMNHNDDHCNSSLLEQLAVIATGPQSPLMQASATSLLSSQLSLGASSKLDSLSLNSTLYDGILPVWNCFLSGVSIKFDKSDVWHTSEHLLNHLTTCTASGITSRELNPRSVQYLGYKSDVAGPAIHVKFVFVDFPISFSIRCVKSHPFYVNSKGWCSVEPDHKQSPCPRLEVFDICVPPSQSGQFDNDDMDAVITLSKMAQLKKDPNGGRRRHTSKPEPGRVKRPMNAFMLFAKRHRMEYMKLYPGKDNRSISVILGERWKRMNPEDRKLFLEEAKTLADEHRKIYPDCWKRRRTQSTSSIGSAL